MIRRMVRQVERLASVPAGGGDRFSGYAVIGLPFRSGHVLALRRFAASSVGPAYTSVWHRDPAGKWTFYSTVAEDLGCGRYFSSGIELEVRADVRIDWTAEHAFRVRVDGAHALRWDVELQPTFATRVMNRLGRMMPESWWKSPRVLRTMSAAASVALATGTMNMTGLAPNGHAFLANPRQMWMVRASHAVVDGLDLGPAGPLQEQAKLRDFFIPQRGVFAIVEAFLEAPAGSAARTWKAVA